ncbi:hypothetical protein [Histidinibacterium aquaticum]|uniref:Glycosyltransferase family 2 protein n=1 Tax=Histidinibacterium aquaticum TaxID=2613962 RepID=A0A5J5GI06_9RHOB|nr:hypothetical protein [Histidinibacterium aquaticum]KAA9007879.1 hypothetical protein F3S47_10155 [Histidinibacterium aquaticum]
MILQRGGTVGVMATFPGRFSFVAEVAASIAPQLDRLVIYVNETLDGFPDLGHLPNVTVLDGRDHAGDLSANAKVYPLDLFEECQVFVLDDDFIFPSDYVARYRAILDLFDGGCCVTTHGSTFLPAVDWYYNRAEVFVSIRGCPRVQLACLAGSGTFAFDQRRLPCRAADFPDEVMVDLQFSLMARRAGLPIWVIDRPEGWLENIKTPGLWERFSTGNITHHTRVAREVDWSFEPFRRIAAEALDRLPDGIPARAFRARLDPDLQESLVSGRVPLSWTQGTPSFRFERDHLEILAQGG